MVAKCHKKVSISMICVNKEIYFLYIYIFLKI